MNKKIFIYNNSSGELELNQPEILLIKEFDKLMQDERNICTEDETGRYKLRAFREFKYIFLMIDWESPYADYSEQERHQEALKDANITEDEFNDEIFRAACRKYREVQDSVREMRLVKATQGTVDKLIIYMENLDLEERDVNGKPIFKANDVIKEIRGASEIIEALRLVEEQVKKNRQAKPGTRGDIEVGYEGADISRIISEEQDDDDF